MTGYSEIAKAKKDPMAEMRQRHKDATDYWSEAFQQCEDDMKFVFVPGHQWNEETARRRKKRPKYEFNHLRATVKQVINEQRQNSPQINIAATEESSVELAETLNGLIRNIEQSSRADVAFDTAGQFQVAGGYGVLGIHTEYASEGSFEQEIVFREVRNPYSCKCDPHAKEYDKRDARYWFEDLSYSRDAFKHKWPDAELADLDQTAHYGDWFTDKEVRVSRYWCKHYDKKTIYLLSDGQVLDEEDYQAIQGQLVEKGQEGLYLEDSREVEYDRIDMSIVSGAEVLEGPYPWAGKFIPLIPVWGDCLLIEGKEVFYGMVRPARDAQVLFNYNMSVAQEQAAKSPNAPFLYTPKMIEGHEEAWKGLATDNAPGLPYNPDPDAPGGMPKRQDPPTFASAFINLAQFSGDQIKAVTGRYDASLGNRSNETSGRAIMARDRQGDTTTFDYADNISRAYRFAGEILVDLIPKIYDTERVVRVLGLDGKDKHVTLNSSVYVTTGPDGQPLTLSKEQAEQLARVMPLPPGEWQVINDLSIGKFSVTVTTGPSFATQRLEMADALMQLANGNGPDATIARFFAIKAMDVPGSEEALKAFRRLLVGQGLMEPDKDDAPPQQAQPDPRAEAEAMLKKAQAMLAEADTKLTEAKTAQTKVDTALAAQTLPLKALQQSAQTEAAVIDTYTKSPDTPYFGPPQLSAPNGQG